MASRSTLFDLSARRRAEAETRDTRVFPDSIIEHIPSMIFVKDARDLRFVLFNRAGEELLGHARRDLLGKNDCDFFPKDEADFFTAKDRLVLDSGEPLDIPEEPIATRHRGPRILHTRKVPILDPQGRPQYLLGISEDITEHRAAQAEIVRLHESIRRHAADLESANRGLETFCYSVSHDLRAPLRAISGFSEAVLEDCAAVLDDRGRDYLERIRAGTRRMGQLIDDLLNLSRLTRSEILRTRVDLSGLAARVARDLAAAHPDRQVDIAIAPVLGAEGDERLLLILLENLLGNAWKFTRQRPRARIEFGVTGEDGGRAFFVRDDGAGFDMAYADKLFGAFQRLHSQQEFEGTGVGLATVARIVHRHGGRVWAEGAVNRGATFYFVLGASALGGTP